MDIEVMVTDAGLFMKDSVWGHWRRWILLTVALVIFPVILGYMMRIYRGGPAPPELEGWGRLFLDGLKYLVITIVYMLPGLLVIALSAIPLIQDSMEQRVPTVTSGLAFLLGLCIAVLLFLIAAVFLYIAIVRAARRGRTGDAFQVGDVLAHIRSLGWVDYLITLLVGSVIVWLGSQVAFLPLYAVFQIPGAFLLMILAATYPVLFVALLIPVIAVSLFLYIPVMIFGARFQSLVYDGGPATVTGEIPATSGSGTS